MATIPVAPVPSPAKRIRKANGTKSTTHTVTVQFTTDDDIDLYNRLSEDAESDRRPLALYILLGLHEHFPAPKGE